MSEILEQFNRLVGQIFETEGSDELPVNFRPLANLGLGDITSDFLVRLGAKRRVAVKKLISEFEAGFKSKQASFKIEFDFLNLRLEDPIFLDNLPSSFGNFGQQSSKQPQEIAIVLKTPSSTFNQYAFLRVLALASLQVFCCKLNNVSFTLYFGGEKFSNCRGLTDTFRELYRRATEFGQRSDQVCNQEVIQSLSTIGPVDTFLLVDTVLFDQSSYKSLGRGNQSKPHTMAPTPDWLHPVDCLRSVTEVLELPDANLLDLILQLASPDKADELDLDDIGADSKYNLVQFAKKLISNFEGGAQSPAAQSAAPPFLGEKGEFSLFSKESTAALHPGGIALRRTSLQRLCFLDDFFLQAAYGRVTDFVWALRDLIYSANSLFVQSSGKPAEWANLDSAILSSLHSSISAIIGILK